MEYRSVVAVTGLPGLYQLLSTKKDGALVRSLADKSVKFVAARKHQITPLESIEIYTLGDNVHLHEVFEKIKEKDAEAEALLSQKLEDKKAKDFFASVLPEYDEERVYTSDIKKIIKWYAILKGNDLLNFDYLKPQPEATESAVEEINTVEEVTTTPSETDTTPAEKPVKKAAKKKAAAVKTDAVENSTEEAAKPAKKTAKKKKEAE